MQCDVLLDLSARHSPAACSRHVVSVALCSPSTDRAAALLQVCAQLAVPLNVVPLTDQYWERVVGHCIADIRAGRTPNPDVLCNSRVKFGAFYEHLEAGDCGTFDRIASGHYARVVRPGDDSASRRAALPEPILSGMESMTEQAYTVAAHPDERFSSFAAAAQAHHANEAKLGAQLRSKRDTDEAAVAAGAPLHSGVADDVRDPKGLGPHDRHHLTASSGGVRGAADPSAEVQLCMTPDALKDQTYFLSHLSQAQLARLTCPLGPLTKREVRALAQHLGLATQSRKDSQGLCFLGKVKFSEFIKVCACVGLARAGADTVP